MPEENNNTQNHPASLPPMSYESAPKPAATQPPVQLQPQPQPQVVAEDKRKLPVLLQKIFSSKNSVVKTIVINVINLGLILGIVYLLGGVSTRATEVSTLRNESLTSKGEADVSVLEAELLSESERISYLRNLMGDESRVLDYLQILDEMEAAGEVNDYLLLTSQPTTDKTRNKGFPISIQINGNQEKLNSAMRKISNLDFLVRPVNFNLNRIDGDNYELSYGIFLYIDE